MGISWATCMCVRKNEANKERDNLELKILWLNKKSSYTHPRADKSKSKLGLAEMFIG